MGGEGAWRALQLDREGDVLRVAIAHPTSALNTVDGLLHGELTRLFRELKRESAARAVLLIGRGRAFSAGGDFRWFPTLDDLDKLEHLRRDAKQMIWDLLDVELPIVAALNGPAVGLGASIALLCDVIFMADTATIVDPHVRVGIVAGDGGTAIWPLVLGPARAKQFLLTGDPVTAAEALAMGLVNAVVPHDQLDAEIDRWCAELLDKSPTALAIVKRSMNADTESIRGISSLGFQAVSLYYGTDEAKEGVAAYKEKRPPRFRK